MNACGETFGSTSSGESYGAIGAPGAGRIACAVSIAGSSVFSSAAAFSRSAQSLSASAAFSVSTASAGAVRRQRRQRGLAHVESVVPPAARAIRVAERRRRRPPASSWPIARAAAARTPMSAVFSCAEQRPPRARAPSAAPARRSPSGTTRLSWSSSIARSRSMRDVGRQRRAARRRSRRARPSADPAPGRTGRVRKPSGSIAGRGAHRRRAHHRPVVGEQILDRTAAPPRSSSVAERGDRLEPHVRIGLSAVEHARCMRLGRAAGAPIWPSARTTETVTGGSAFACSSIERSSGDRRGVLLRAEAARGERARVAPGRLRELLQQPESRARSLIRCSA